MTNKASDADATPTSVLVAQLYNGGWPSNDAGASVRRDARRMSQSPA